MLPQLFDPRVKKYYRHYLLQSLMAIAVLFVILAILELQAHLVVIASIGSSVFVVFVMPKMPQARPRSLIGGHLVGLCSGAVCYVYVLEGSLSQRYFSHEMLLVVAGALSVGLAIFLMSLTNTEHAPAAGTALGITIQGLSYTAVVFVVASVVGLSIFRWLFRNQLRNLS